jgi:hypothetical protein
MAAKSKPSKSPKPVKQPGKPELSSPTAKAKAEQILAQKAARAAKPAEPAAVQGSKAKAGSTGKGGAKGSIPEAVSKRMFGRMVVFSGIPSLLGLFTFPLSYLLITKVHLELPNALVVVASLGLFGLGALGLTYGVLSASWDEADPGSMLGWPEFRLNFGRVSEGWRNRKQV